MFSKLTLLAICLFSITGHSQVNTKSVQIFEQEKLLELINLNDDTVRLFNFWATWCRPCVKELPYLEEFGHSMADSSFRQYLVSLDFREDIDKKLIPFIQKKELKSQVIVFDAGNPNDWIDLISPEWSGTIPATLIVYHGKKNFFEGGYENVSEIKDHYYKSKYNGKN